MHRTVWTDLHFHSAKLSLAGSEILYKFPFLCVNILPCVISCLAKLKMLPLGSANFLFFLGDQRK